MVSYILSGCRGLKINTWRDSLLSQPDGSTCTCHQKGDKRRVYQQDFTTSLLTNGDSHKRQDKWYCTCKFSTIVVEKDEYRDGHHEPDQKPPVFSFLAAC